MNPRRGGWLIFVTLLAAVLASVVHLPASVPDWVGHFRPDWIVAVMFYWSFAASERTGLVEAWLLGFVVDVLVGDPLGLNGACMAGAVFSGHVLHERIRLYLVLQRAGVALGGPALGGPRARGGAGACAWHHAVAVVPRRAWRHRALVPALGAGARGAQKTVSRAMSVPIVVLASASARRRALMRQAGFEFRVLPADIDETPHPGEEPCELVLRLAAEKAQTVAGKLPTVAWAVVGADTVVVSPDGELFGKPRGREDFLAMFRALRGRSHRVLTGVAVVAGGRCRAALAQADVTLRDASEEEMAAYWAQRRAA